MNAPDDSREMTIIESKGILIHDQIFHTLLTDRRIILTSYSDNKLIIRSLYLADIQKIEEDTDDSGDPVIIVVTLSATGEIKKVVLHFSQENFSDPQQVRLLWYTQINKMISPTIPVSPDDTLKKGSFTQAFCLKCGNRVVDGSVFCNGCGTKITYPAQPIPLQQGEEPIPETVKTPEISTGKIDLSPKKISITNVASTHTKEKVPINTVRSKESPKKKPFFTGSEKRKPAILAISALVGIIVLIAAIFVILPSPSHGFNPTSSEMNFTTPDAGPEVSPTQTLATSQPTPKISMTPSPLVQPYTPAQAGTPVQASTPLQTHTPSQTSTPTRTPTPVHTSTPVRTPTTVQTSTPTRTPTPLQAIFSEVLPIQPVMTLDPQDPSSTLASYRSFFNSGDSTALYSLLSLNMTSNYTINNLTNDLASARSNGYLIDTIKVNIEMIDENNATLEVDISWKVAGSPVTSSPSIYLVYENNKWKLDNLVLSP